MYDAILELRRENEMRANDYLKLCREFDVLQSEVNKWREVSEQLFKSAQAGVDALKDKGDPIGRAMRRTIFEIMKFYIESLELKGLPVTKLEEKKEAFKNY